MSEESIPLPKEELGVKRRLVMKWTGVTILFAGLVVLALWLFYYRFIEYTDDAYVSGNLVELTPQVAGIIASINVDNTDYVEEGQVLIELDKTDYIFALEKSCNELAETVREVVQMFLKVEELEAQLQVKEAELMKAEQDYENRVNLVNIGAVSTEEFEHVEAALKSARASAKETYHTLQAAYAQVQGTTVRTHPLVRKGAQQVKDDWVSLRRCEIVSPVNGYVSQRVAQLGEWVNLAEPLLAIVPLDELWVDANFKETQLSDFRIGQDVKLRADLYGWRVTYQGKVIGINPGTGNTFSILPPQNATGNWIKIVQRVPVRISLDSKQLERNPLWLGLSMDVTVDIKDTSGDRLSEYRVAKPIYRTSIYSQQELGADALIEQIISSNIGSHGT
ncbi:HlyD family secretion protein [Simkania negevensis]|uniref:Multidrug resistance protein A n=1 Tax=Simkania negevensis (strain ATCC VR-1471 / DSM 27360 / Z) TaxID=331113 RepID=F8L827_SIMNZ|nr:HlyD family efflux transporter periplasmic adaptor subunit [Simkania negevensis]CCB88929.1 multidrug resistance protein A [Simkania negevensis Z]